MSTKPEIPDQSPFPSAKEDAASISYDYGTPQTKSASYRLAFDDIDFIMRDEMRPVRLQLEVLKPELSQLEREIKSTVAIFGSARIPEQSVAEHNLEKAQQAVASKGVDLFVKYKTIPYRPVMTYS